MGLPRAIQIAKVLMVGAGGIGCELLKTIVLTGFQHIHVIDMDTIEVSNLNRQFLFRKRHVGQSKSKVAREALLKLRPDVDIVSHHANVKSPQFDVEFFQQFSLVLNGLDNLDARRHVNRLCLAANVPLVESGTTGYLGQVTVHIRGRTECYECQPKPAPKTYPVCTITSTPSKPVHCIVWAKDLAFMKLFGDKTQASDLDVRVNNEDGLPSGEPEVSFFDVLTGESSRAFGARIFDRLFGHNITTALENEDAWKERRKPCPLYLADIFQPGELEEDSRNDSSVPDDEPGVISAMTRLGLKNPQEIWNVKTNAKVFLQSVRLYLERRNTEIGKFTFDKDDDLAVEFVTASANLRAHSFGIPVLSLFEAKGIAGNIVHAIATTNAVIAGLIVLESIKLLEKDIDACQMTYCLEHPSKKLLLMPVDPFEPNPSCYVCSKTPLVLEVNTYTTTLREVVDKMVTRKLGANCPIIMLGSNVIYETGDDLEKDMVAHFEKNLDKKLSSFPIPITSGTVITVEDLQQEFTCTIHVKHRETFSEEEVDGMVLSGLTQDPSVTIEPALEAEQVVNPKSHDQAPGGTDDDPVMISGDLDGDFIITATKDSMKRKLEGDEQDDLPKKVKV
ncbi:unnamed protein product [Calypogeia fissa]